MKWSLPILLVAFGFVFAPVRVAAENDAVQQGGLPEEARIDEAAGEASLPGTGTEAGRYREQAPERGAEMSTYLGVATTGLPPTLREHFGIKEGFGVVIQQVMPHSPAEEAGLQPKDIVTRLDDQLITTPEHLSLLVRSMEAGREVAVSIIRRGEQQVVRTALGQTRRLARPDRLAYPPAMGGPRSPHQWEEAARHFQDHWKNWLERHRPGQLGSPSETAKGEGESSCEGEDSGALPEPDGERAVGKPPALSVEPGFPLKIFGTKGVVQIDNQEGEVTIRNGDDGHTITIRDKEGEKVYEGPFDPEEGLDSLPAEASEQLKRMKLENLEILLPDPVEGGPEPASAKGRVIQPLDGGIL